MSDNVCSVRCAHHIRDFIWDKVNAAKNGTRMEMKKGTSRAEAMVLKRHTNKIGEWRHFNFGWWSKCNYHILFFRPSISGSLAFLSEHKLTDIMRRCTARDGTPHRAPTARETETERNYRIFIILYFTKYILSNFHHAVDCFVSKCWTMATEEFHRPTSQFWRVIIVIITITRAAHNEI